MSNRLKPIHLRIVIGGVVLLLAALAWMYETSFFAVRRWAYALKLSPPRIAGMWTTACYSDLSKCRELVVVAVLWLFDP